VPDDSFQGPDAASKLPHVTPHTKCRLKLLKLDRIKDYLLMEEEFIRNQVSITKYSKTFFFLIYKNSLIVSPDNFFQPSLIF
jgi:hypothetical protein